jgi:hypothetical protein
MANGGKFGGKRRRELKEGKKYIQRALRLVKYFLSEILPNCTSVIQPLDQGIARRFKSINI